MSDSAVTARLPNVVFRRFELMSAPGIDTGFVAEQLASGLNVIIGPNASGKSTLSRAIHCAIWPSPKGQPGRFRASFDFDGSCWVVAVSDGIAQYQRDGIVCSAPLIGQIPAETRDRYLITLHDLLDATQRNGVLATTVKRESSGGYDLIAAGERFGYKEKNPRKGQELKDLQSAKQRVRSLEQQQAVLAESEAHLSRLETEIGTARRKLALKTPISNALERESQRRQVSTCEARLSGFSPAMSKLLGDEITRLEAIYERLHAARERVAASIVEAERHHAEIAKTGLAATEIEPVLISELRETCRSLGRLDSEIANLERNHAAAVAELADARARIAPEITDEQLGLLNASGIRNASELVAEQARVTANRQARDAMNAWLGGDPPGEDVEALTAGLHEAMRIAGDSAVARAGESSRRALVVAVVSLALLASAFVALTITSSPIWLIGLIVPVAGALYLGSVWRNRESRPDGSRPTAVLTELGVGSPDSPEACLETIKSLGDRLSAAKFGRERSQRWAALAGERAQLAADEIQLEEERRELAAALGIDAKLGSAELRMLADNVARWQQSSGRDAAETARLDDAQRERIEGLTSISSVLGPFGYSRIDSTAQAHVAVEALAERVSVRDRSAEFERKSRDQIERVLQPEVERLVGERSAFFAALDCDDGDTRMVESCLTVLPEYRAISKSRADALAVISSLDGSLAAYPQIESMSEPELQVELAESEAAANRIEELSTKVAEIQTRIADAKQSRSIESALAEVDACKERIKIARDADLRTNIGWEILQYVERQSRDWQRPPVFQRAQEIFHAITNGAFRLNFNERGTGSFEAIDEATGTGRTLEQLSSATKVHLLMAVRLAFVEVTEQGPMLPLMLDETLGNTDDERAGAVIDAALNCCRAGRQVFYFTAQPDEVSKWTTRLTRCDDIEWTVIDLAQARGLARPVGAPGAQEPPASPRLSDA